MDTRRLVVWITFIAIFTMAARVSVDTDTWWHLRAGEWVVDERAILDSDFFSYTRYGEPWDYPGWLVEVPMVLIYRAFGPGGLNLWTAAMVTLAFFFVWRTLSGGAFLRAFVIILATTVSGVYWAARPYLVTFLLTAITLWILESHRFGREKADRRRMQPGLWWLPVLMVVWANSHGGFIVGFLLWGVYWLADLGCRLREVFEAKGSILSLGWTRSPLTLCGAVMLVAVCLNPSGPAMLTYPFKTIGIGVLQAYIQEWQSPDFHSLVVQPFAWMILLVIAAVGFSRNKLAFIDFALVSGFAYLGLMAGRNIALFAIVAPMVITRHLEPSLIAARGRLGIKPASVRARSGYLNFVLLFLILVVALVKIFSILPEAANRQALLRTFPVQAVEYLQTTQPPGRLFNSYNWGSYLIWALREYPVFVDGRTDLYDDEILDQWLRVARAEPGWQSVLEHWDIKLVLVERNMPIVSALDKSGWQGIYQDDIAVIFRR